MPAGCDPRQARFLPITTSGASAQAATSLALAEFLVAKKAVYQITRAQAVHVAEVPELQYIYSAVADLAVRNEALAAAHRLRDFHLRHPRRLACLTQLLEEAPVLAVMK